MKQRNVRDSAGLGAVSAGCPRPEAALGSGPVLAPLSAAVGWLSGWLALLALLLGIFAPVAESAITYLGQSSANTGQTPATSLTLAKPTDAAVGEVLVAILGGGFWGGNATAFAAPAGWTVINNTTYGSLNLPTFYHVVQAGDPASWTWSTSGAQTLNGTLLRYSGVNTGNPLDIAATATNSGAQTITAIAPSVTTATAGALVIRAFAATTGVPTANPANSRVMVRLIGNGGTSTAPLTQGVSDVLQASAGATGTANFTLEQAAFWRAITFALRPADPLSGQISGSVYRDYKADGARGSNDAGLEGIVVKAVDASGNSVTTTTVGPDGAYTILAATGSPSALSGQVRLEFTRPADGSLDFLEPGKAGGTTVQFANISTGAIGVNAGFNNPVEYSQANPFVAVPAFYNGTAVSNGARPGIIGHAYTADSFTPALLNLATSAQVGTTWGVAYQPGKKRLFASSFLRRHAGFSRGPGHVHVVNWTGSAGSYAGSFNLQGVNPANGGAAIDLGSVCRRDTISGGGTSCGNATDNTVGANASPNIDLDAYDKVGKVSFGDADLDDGQNTLWLVNLNQRALISVDVSGGFTDGTVPGTVNQYLIASLPGLPTCTNGYARPWGLKFHEGKGYLGVVCDASGGWEWNLQAMVLRFNPSDVSAGFTTVLNFPLNYSNRFSYSNTFLYPDTSWKPWTATWKPDTDGTYYNGAPYFYPQPVLSDIEFAEDGSLRVGLMDRFGIQTGSQNYDAVSGTTTTGQHRSMGEIVEACRVSGGYALEGSAGCPGRGWVIGNSGPSAGGYRYEQISGDGAQYASDGGLGWLPGSGEVMQTMMDPYPSTYSAGADATAFYTAGTGRYNAAGAHVAGANLIPAPSPLNATTFGKAVSLGDLEFLVDAAPLEIGNRVWDDTNGNGIQDPGEAPLAGVTVTLKNAAGTVISSAVTDANGNYLFSNGSGTSTTSAKYGLAGLTPDTSGYQLVIATGDSALGGRHATLANADATTDGELRDSNGIVSGSSVIATFDTGPAGANDHTLDFGFTTVTTYSLGNRVWLDNGAGGGTANDGIRNGGEAGLAGVVVTLYAADGSGNPTGGALATTTTDANGYYRFDGLAAGSYVPVVDVTASGSALSGYVSSTGASSDVTLAGDLRDHGRDTPLAAGSVLPGGIVGATATLGPSLQPTGEATSGSGAGANGGFGDTADNLTVDFGFYSPASTYVALGNRVWLDNGAGGGTSGDGIQNGSEAGVAGVTVELYNASNTLVGTTTTNAAGYYYFDNLVPGSYSVKIPASQFGAGQPLAGLLSSPGADTTTTTDLNDNGIDDASPATNGIRSNAFILAIGTMPTGEDQTGYPGSLPDASVNGTNDFGFYTAPAAVADLKIVKTVSNSQPPLGQAYTYTLQVTNQPGGAATTLPVQMVDTPPTGVTLTAVNPPAGWTCVTAPPGSALSLPLIGNGSKTLTCDRSGAMAAGATETFTLTAKATQSAIAPATGLINHATVTGDGDTPDPTKPDGSYASNHDKAPVNPTAPAIGLLKTVALTDETGTADGQAQAGEKLTYTLTVTNRGNVDLTPVSLTDGQLDAGSLNCAATTSLGNGFSLSGPTSLLRPTESVVCTGKHTLTSAEATAGHVANTANTAGKAPDGTPVNATATGVWDNTPAAGETLKGRVSLVKTAVHNDGSNGQPVNGRFDAGETVTYGFIVRNVGDQALNSLAVTDPLLASVGSTITCGASSLAVGATTTCTVSPAYVLTAADVAAGQVTNTASVGGLDPASNPVTDADTRVLHSGEPVSLELEKTAVLVPGLQVGDTLTYTLVATNTGGEIINSVTLVDNLGVIGACSPAQGSNLAPGQQMKCSATHTIQTGETSPIANLGTASGTAEGRGVPTQATAHHLVPYLQPTPAPTYSVGDKLFWDFNNDGQMNGSDAGIPGVVVQLQRWNGSAWVPATYADASTIPNQATDSTGYYLFQNVPLNTAGQPYRVAVLAANFGTGASGNGVLYGALSSGTDSTDFTAAGNNRDHGIGTQPQSTGIVSPSFDLNDLPNGVYDLPTVDFGFTKKSIGAAPDLAFTSSVSAPTAGPGVSVNLTLSASNLLGAGNLTRVPAMTEILPAGLSVDAGVGSSFVQGHWRCSVNSTRSALACSYTGSLPLPGGASLGAVTVPVTVGAGVPIGTVLTANGGITKLTGEPNYTNNLHSVSVTVQ